jgi:hypothetical protein
VRRWIEAVTKSEKDQRRKHNHGSEGNDVASSGIKREPGSANPRASELLAAKIPRMTINRKSESSKAETVM